MFGFLIGPAVKWFLGTGLGKAIPSWAWELMGTILVAAGLYFAHHVAVVHHDNGVRAAQKATDDAAAKKLADQAIALKAKIDGLTSNISTLIRTKTDEQAAANAASAADILRGGPGKAGVCRASLPATPGGHVAAPSIEGTAGPALPPADSATVPWSWLVTRAQEHDDLLNETKAWREWYQKLVAAWPKENSNAAH